MEISKKDILVLVLSFLFISTNSVSAQINFTDYFRDQNLNYGYGNGILGGGVSFADINQDGFDDLSFTTGQGQNLQFFLSNGTDLIPTELGISYTCESKQLLWIDYDNDGDLDLIVMCLGGKMDLFVQTATMLFELQPNTFEFPIANFSGYSFTALDINKNGFLDIIVTSYNNKGTYLFLNDQNGSYEIKGGTGLEIVKKPTLQIINFDFNNDGWEDIYLANDRSAGNNLLLNNGDSTFTDISEESKSGIAMDAMGLITLNTDNNIYPDLYISNSNEGNVLLQNKNGTEVIDIAQSTGTVFGGSSWGISLLDFDLDGAHDIYVSGSDVGSNTISSSLLKRTARDRFEEIDPVGMVSDTVESFGNAVGDFNNDGKPDLAVNNSSQFLHNLWENTSENDNNWIKIGLQGELTNNDGIGARIEYFNNGSREVLWKHSTYSYLSQSSLTQTIGLGQKEKVDSLIIYWPSGIIDRHYDLSANERYNLIEGITETPQKITFDALPEQLCGGDQINASLLYSGRNIRFLWSDGNTSGERTFTQDFKGSAQIFSGEKLISQTETIDLKFEIIPEPEIIIEINESGATASLEFGSNPSNYDYQWSHNTSLNFHLARGLEAGIYTVIVTNENGCQITVEFEIPTITSLPESETHGIEIHSNYGVWSINFAQSLNDPELYLLTDFNQMERIPIKADFSSSMINFRPNHPYILLLKSKGQALFRYRFIILN